MKAIKVTAELIEESLKKLREQLEHTSEIPNKLSVSLDFAQTEGRVPTVKLSKNATRQLLSIMLLAPKEVGWHGTVKKEKTDNVVIYTIEELFIFPQQVTGTTVSPEQVAYQTWLHTQLPKGTIDKLRFHGHSHVNMATSPSGTDVAYQNAVKQDVQDFYIFAIFNKNLINWFSIYDVEDNIVYEDADITVEYEDADFMYIASELNAKVTETTYKYTVAQNTRPTTKEKPNNRTKATKPKATVKNKQTKSEVSATDALTAEKKATKHSLLDGYYDGYGNWYEYGSYHQTYLDGGYYD